VIEQNGTAAGARWFLPNFVVDHSAQGTENIPDEGPLLIAANHPAAYDGVVISAYVYRPDYKIIIGQDPPYEYLPALGEHPFSPPPETVRAHADRRKSINISGRRRVVDLSLRAIDPIPRCADLIKNSTGGAASNFLRNVPTYACRYNGKRCDRLCMPPDHGSEESRSPEAGVYVPPPRQAIMARSSDSTRVTFGEVLYGMNPQSILSEVERAARRTLDLHMSHTGLQIGGSAFQA
jgi:hypothetical protein